MAEQDFRDSVYRFTDPVRYFKANDPYYFEVDNIPLKQLQENCLWLKDQLRQVSPELRKVKRGDIDELRPYSTGGDRVVRVKPGRYTARVNDAGTRTPLSFLTQTQGGELGDMDAYSAQIPNNTNAVLSTTLDKFKSSLAADALSINGLENRLFTWPVFSVDTPISNTGVDLDSDVNFVKYGTSNNPGAKVKDLAAVVSEAISWAKGTGTAFTLFTLDGNDITGSDGFSLLPRLESHFVKYWRGAVRTAVVDVEDELTIEVPAFDANDFSYVDDNGNTQPVEGVASRIDMIFIYSKPVDASSTTILKPSGKTVITKPQLGIVRGAGIRAKYEDLEDPSKGRIEYATDEHLIMGAAGDSDGDSGLGFTATSGNDIAFDVRGSFPAPDDILNLAPLLSEKLEDGAIELVGQSILPVAYVWVKNEGDTLTNGSVPVLTTDVIDIRPFFRTTELAYNERAGIAGAMPQLSLANPAVGKSQLDYEIKRSYEFLKNEIDVVRDLIPVIDDGDTNISIVDSLVGDLTIHLDEPIVVWNVRGNPSVDQNPFVSFDGGVDPQFSNSDYETRYRLTSPQDLNGLNLNVNPALLARPEITNILGANLEKLSQVKTSLVIKFAAHGVQTALGGSLYSFYIDGNFANASPEVPLDYATDLENFILADKDSFGTTQEGENGYYWANVPFTTSMNGINPIGRYTKYCVCFFGDSEKYARQVADSSMNIEIPVTPINNQILLHLSEAHRKYLSRNSFASIEAIKITRS